MASVLFTIANSLGVYAFDLRAKVIDEGLAIELFSGRQFHQLDRAVPAPVSMDLEPKPIQDRLEVPSSDHRIQGPEFLLHGFGKLGCIQITQGVSREVPDQAGAPVNILKHSVSIVGRTYSQVLFVSSVPSFREIGDGQAIFEKLLLELKTDHDVKVVGHFVGFDPYQTRFDAVYFGEDFGRLGLIENARKKGCSLGNAHVQNARLRPITFSQNLDWDSWIPNEQRFQQGVRTTRSQTLLVHAVSRFMQRAIETTIEVIRIVTSQDPMIAWTKRGAKRMIGFIQSASLEIETDLFGDPTAGASLTILVILRVRPTNLGAIFGASASTD